MEKSRGNIDVWVYGLECVKIWVFEEQNFRVSYDVDIMLEQRYEDEY